VGQGFASSRRRAENRGFENRSFADIGQAQRRIRSMRCSTSRCRISRPCQAQLMNSDEDAVARLIRIRTAWSVVRRRRHLTFNDAFRSDLLGHWVRERAR
jgi:hypothetical protein